MTKIDSLKRRQKKTVTDAFVTDYDYIDEDGYKIKDNSFMHPEFGEIEEKANMTKLFGPSLSTTTDISILVIEARLLEDDRLGRNPHIPATMEILEQAKRRIEANDLTPAWSVFEQSSDGQSGRATAD